MQKKGCYHTVTVCSVYVIRCKIIKAADFLDINLFTCKITFPNHATIRLDFPARGGMPPVKVFYHDSARATDADVYHVPGMENETIPAIMERMTAGKFRHVPVIEQERLVGIISIGDVVKHRIEEIEHETEALKDYILTA